MMFLIPTFDCVVFDGCLHEMKANAKYVVSSYEKNKVICFSDFSFPYIFSLDGECENVLKIDYKGNQFCFLFPIYFRSFMTKIKYGASDIELSMSDKIVLSCCGDVIFEREVEQLNYSHFEVVNGFCLIYFSGKRDFVIVLKDKEIIFSDYYDEYNVNENERLFMVRLFDSLNHGKVLRIDGKDFETYLVYLDDNDLELKRDFVSHVFLDCVKAGNLKYANNLLCENLKMEQVNLIQKFFPDFDYFYPIGQNEFVLINKKALAGIFEFELINDKISNINCR